MMNGAFSFVRHLALSNISLNPLPHATADKGTVSTVLDIVFTIVGSISLLVIVIAGFRYTLSRGDSRAVAQARQAIIYAAVGMVVTIMGFSIVTFVLNGI